MSGAKLHSPGRHSVAPPAARFVALALACWPVFGLAQSAIDPLPAQARLVAAAGAATPTRLPFTLLPADSGDLVVTLTDMRIPGALVSADVVVTQAGAIVASSQLAAPATTATATIAGASGDYVLYVFGVPNAGYSVGTFTVCVAPKSAPSNCIAYASLAGNITAPSTANDPTVSTLSASLSVTTPGSYTFTFADLAFPAALNTAPNLALFQGSTLVCPPGVPVSAGVCTNPQITSGTVFTLSSGTYTLLAIAQADQTTKRGLYGITIAGPAGTASLLDEAVPVGLASPASLFLNSTAQTLTLTVSDYGFPGPVASASALLTTGGRSLGSASAAGGAVSVPAPSGTLSLWTFGSAGATPGTYSADVAGATDLNTVARGVQPAGSGTYAYAFVAPLLSAGGYQATVADLQFPSQLSALAFAVAQNGLILQQSAGAAAVNFTAGAGNAVLLVTAQPPASGSASGSGLFDVNVQTTGASASLVYDKTQIVSGSSTLFDAQQLNLGVNASFDARLTDLKFPAAFDTLALVISRGTSVLGKVYAGSGTGTFSFNGTPGAYQVTAVATPASSPPQQFGLYGVSITYSAPTVTLTSGAATAAIGAPVQLTWSSTNATSCTPGGGNFTGSVQTSGTQAVVLAATTTFTLSCTGPGGSATQSVTVTATAAPAKSGGGGLDWSMLAVLGVWVLVRRSRVRLPVAVARL